MKSLLSSVADLRSFLPHEGSDRPRRVVGYGKSFASFGEIAQGRLSTGDDFLCTMPVDLWSTCHLDCTPIHGPLVVECDMAKSRDMVSLALESLGITKGFHISIEFTRNIPIGKGLSSSTADMLAALRATQEVFGFLLKETFISGLMSMIEPHDALHYNSSVAYNHRKGVLLRDFGHIPQWSIVIADQGGEVDTVNYNKKVSFEPDHLGQYDVLLQRLIAAFAVRHDREIARCASESARLHVAMTGNPFLADALNLEADLGAMGTIATHSGTCAGFLFPPQTLPAEIDRIAATVGTRLGCHVFATRSLTLLA